MSRLLTLIMAFLVATSAGAAQIEIRLKDGSRWRGQVNDSVHVEFLMGGVTVSMDGKLVKVDDLYVQVDGTFANAKSKKTIFKSDIVAMKTTGAAAPSPGGAVASAAVDAQPDGTSGKPANQAAASDLGVFVLPLKGTVGETMRSDEIKRLADYIDKNYGPGQIIVLEIESPGGIMIECEKIHYTIQEIRKRHRVVAWIKEAISAAAATASNCDEIYFKTTGTLGAMTMFNGGTGISVKGEELAKWLDTAGDWFESNGRSKYVAWSMIDDVKMCSYDKDPETGQVTWYGDLSGEFVLSDEKTNLVLNARTALHCKFSGGTADTNAELAKLLDLPSWNEKSDYGRKIAKEWQDTVAKAKEEIPLLFARYDYKGSASGGKAKIGVQIGIMKDLIRWWDRCSIVCMLSGVPPKESLERQVEELKRALARMN